jgi:hypothetical protein
MDPFMELIVFFACMYTVAGLWFLFVSIDSGSSGEPFIPSPTPPPTGTRHARTNAALVAGVSAVAILVGIALFLVITALSGQY